MLFTRLYATGTRTVRGLEALTLSVPPLPGVSIVKRPGNEGFFSWGTVMKDKGYETKYIYAGYGYFDNMSYFFSHNGFSIVDRSSFAKDEITFANIWGVCDEDLFKKTIREADRSWKAGQTLLQHGHDHVQPSALHLSGGQDRHPFGNEPGGRREVCRLCHRAD